MSLENVTHPFYAIENYLIPSMALFLIFHSLYAIGVKNTNGAVKLKGKRTIIPLAPIPCPLSTTTDVWDPHIRFIFNRMHAELRPPAEEAGTAAAVRARRSSPWPARAEREREEGARAAGQREGAEKGRPSAAVPLTAATAAPCRGRGRGGE